MKKTIINKDFQEQIEHLKNMTEEETYANALSDPDCQPITNEQAKTFVGLYGVPGRTISERFKNAQKRRKISVTARFDADVVEWYRSKGKGYQTLMNAALRAVMEAELATGH